ncbi:FAD/NAD(P)-binding protein [Neorhizobium sp. AL 9.2.2]|uniref:FAD/NAD(P)-binding protein n=1 Tax=Neorhizobium sp. AL 9.2.2 TaxID=2712894 RepID=UPI0015725016|nr:SidA/IucD/PvdA family monooxygenase [Neorhizobium sp. AL 9.2.2]
MTASKTSERPEPTRSSIAIIGGGVTGAAVAFHLATGHKADAVDITIFEPRAEIGRGLAYDTRDPVHRINVPATRMSILPGDPEHFSRWMETTGSVADDEAAFRADGNVFPRRGIFGNYVLSNLQPLLASGAVRHICAAVTGVEKRHDQWHVTDTAGQTLVADILVIAATHPAPVAPRSLRRLAEHPRYVADPTAPNALTPIRADDRVLVVGNGLTSADVIASLKRCGHSGSITALSRRGLRSRGHATVAQEPFGDFLDHPATSASEILHRVRAAIREAQAEGQTWHAVLDQLRSQGGGIWKHLPLEARRRIVRHLRPYWDVHRFRIAPQVEDVLDAEAAAGRLDILAAGIVDVSTDGDIIDVTIKRRGQDGVEVHQFDAVAVTTGPAHGNVLQSQQWLRQLGDQGFLHLDPTGLGLSCNEQSNAIDADGKSEPKLFIAGPLARGHFGELMGFPQVAEHALLVADSIAANL